VNKVILICRSRGFIKYSIPLCIVCITKGQAAASTAWTNADEFVRLRYEMAVLLITGPGKARPRCVWDQFSFAMQVLELGDIQLAYEYTPRNASTTCLIRVHTEPRTLPPQCR
jgi:hypothetical protein